MAQTHGTRPSSVPAPHKPAPTDPGIPDQAGIIVGGSTNDVTPGQDA